MSTSEIHTKEVEVRAILPKERMSKFLASVQENCLVKHDPIRIIDTYYCPVAVHSFEEIEMDAVGSFSLRLRQQTSPDGTVVELNSKVITSTGDHSAWDEHEVLVSSFDDADALLRGIGFKPFFTLKKTRTVFDFEGLNLCLEDIDDFGLGIEVEVMTDDAGVDSAKQRIYDFLKSHGVEQDDIVEKTITNMLMHKWARF